MLSSVFEKKSRAEDLKRYTQESNRNVSIGNAGCAADLCRTDSEVDALKQNLERSENELGRARKQLEDKEGM